MLWRSHSSGPILRPPGFVEPCLPTNGHVVPIGPQWAYEIKHDGFRFICWRVGDRMRVFSRRGAGHAIGPFAAAMGTYRLI